jgi:hypothetical protein
MLSLDGPLPRPPEYGLLSVARRLGADRWTAGAALWPYPSALPAAEDPCAAITLRVKDTPTEVTIPDGFAAWTAYLGEVCSAMGIGSWESFLARADVAMEAATSWALERQLAAGDFAAGNPNLGDANVDLLASGNAVAARVALSYLEDAIAATGRAGVIHATPSVVAAWGYDALTVEDGVLKTLNGTLVVSGQGYVGADAPTGGDAADPGESWIYATHDVLFEMSGILALPETLSEALDREINEVVYRAERDLWVGWDGVLQAAVLADWSP